MYMVNGRFMVAAMVVADSLEDQKVEEMKQKEREELKELIAEAYNQGYQRAIKCQ